jgi:hypothetical protein
VLFQIYSFETTPGFGFGFYCLHIPGKNTDY